MTDLVAAGLTSVGRVRALNEDAWYAGQHLFVVADGMGGHAAGDVASDLAIRTLAAHDRPDVGQAALATAVLEANAAVLEHARVQPETVGLGSTVCGVARTQDGWLVFNAGDSRCYVIDRGTLRQVTVDHSEVQEMIDGGLLTKEQGRVHPERNVITRAIGQYPPPEVDFFVVPAGTGVRIVIATDGLHSEIDDRQIAQICTETVGAADLAHALVLAAEETGGHDNITVIVVDDLSEPDPNERSTSTTVPRDLIVREVAQNE